MAAQHRRPSQVSAFGSKRVRYSDQPGLQNSLRNANRSVAGLAYAHAFSGGGPTCTWRIFRSEDQREATRPTSDTVCSARASAANIR